MKLKDSTFAIIAEKQNSISHKWFNQNIKNNKPKQHVFWEHANEYYIYDKGIFIRCTENRPKDIPIYTESEFERLLESEELNSFTESTLSGKPKELTEMPTWSKTVGLEEPKVIKHRYSGAKSKKFWKIVNSIENEADRQEMYSLGVMLQRNEEYVLSQLRNLNIVAVV